MAKRSREDFEPSSPEDSEATGELESPALSVDYPNPIASSSAASKIIHLDTESGEARPVPEMRCSLPPHRQTLSFPSYDDYEVHYAKTHVNRCIECRKNFPTEHFLNLHIEESHDALVSVKRERGEKTYACFVEDCDRNCSTPEKRKMHLIDKHLFPKDYDFRVVNDGIDRRSSMLRSGRHRRRSSAAQHMTDIDERARRRNSTLKTIDATQNQNQEDGISKTEGSEADAVLTPPNSKDYSDMEGLTGAMSALKFVPPSVRFGRGRGRGRGGFSRT